MKTLFTILFAITFLASNAKEIKELSLSYSIDSTVKDLSLKKNQSKFTFTFKKYPLPSESREFYYSTGQHQKENLVGKLDDKNKFSLHLESGNYRFQFYHSDRYYEITTDSIYIESQFVLFISLNLELADEMMIVDKPVIYLYPRTPTLVEVSVNPKGDFTFTYPVYGNGWSVFADPSGELTMNDKKYNYLFWEAEQNLYTDDFNFSQASIVNKENTISFLERKLTEFGMNSKEQEDFITFWGPKLMQNENNLIHFVINEEAELFADLTISPMPTAIYRIYIVYTNPKNIKYRIPTEQILPAMDRRGFIVLEWGGTELLSNPDL